MFSSALQTTLCPVFLQSHLNQGIAVGARDFERSLAVLQIIKFRKSLRRISYFVRAEVAKNPKVHCTNVKILTQPPALATCQKIIDSL